MKGKILSTILLCTLITTFNFAGGINAKAVSPYDQTTINSDLNATVIPDHIVLTWTGDPTTTQAITWRTIKTVASGEVQYRKKGDSSFTTVSASKSIFTTTNADSQGSENIFTVSITGLTPGTTYEYQVGDGTNFSAISTFATETVNNTKAKFIVFGDSQSGIAGTPTYSPWHDTIQEAYSQNKDANFIANMGDLVEIGQMYQHWNNWFASAQGVIDQIPEMPVQGNHETYADTNYNTTNPQYFVNQFALPQNGPYGHVGQVYSYNYANIHFVVLDSQEDEEAPKNDTFLQQEATWLDKDLSSNTQKWTIVMFHKTPYYNKKTRNNPAVKDILTPVIEKHHVDIVFNGHDHGISRTYPINGSNYYTDYSKGTVYYVTGRSGNKFYTDLNAKVWDASFTDCQDSPSYEVVQVNNGQLTIKAYKYSTTNPQYSTPALIDTLTIDKDNPSNSTKLTLNESVNTQLAIAGTLQANYNATISNNKAYIDPSLIAKYYGGTYNADSLTLTINKINYTFTKTDTLNGDSSLVNLDAVYKSGIDCSYNDALNCILVDITGRVNTAGFTGFTIGQSSSAPTAQNLGTTTSTPQSSLPNTGSVIDTEVLVLSGLAILVIGIVLMKEKTLIKHKNANQI